MKKRSCFVSNSSSSSFTLVIQKDLYEQIYEKLNDLEKVLAKKLLKEKNFFVVYSGWSDNGGGNHLENYTNEDFHFADEEEFDDTLYDLDHTLRKLAKKLDPKEEKFIYEDMDW